MLVPATHETEATMRRANDTGSSWGIALGIALAVMATGPAAHASDEAYAIAEVAAPAEAVWALLVDFAHWDQVFPSVASIAVERVDERHVRLHTRTRVAGRTVRYTLAARIDPDQRRIDCTLDRSAPSDVLALGSSWQVRETPDGGARIELSVRSESGLAVPGFLERRMTALSTRQSVDALVTALGAQRRPATLLASAD